MIEQIVPHATCLACSGCCRFLERHSQWAPCLLKEEAEDLSLLGIPPALLDEKYRICPEPAKQAGMFVCPALDEQTNACSVYGVRPFECQLYPFLLKESKGKFLLAVDPNCPFVLEHKDSPAFKEYVQRLVTYLQLPSRMAMLADNKHLFKEYPETLDVAELRV